MTPEEILAHKPRTLTQAQREAYFADGYLLLERLIPQDWLDRLHAVTDRLLKESRGVIASGEVFDIAPGHGAEHPKVRRFKKPDEVDPEYWAFAQDLIADVAADLVGPNVAYHHSKLNFKWHDGSDEVKWHQDIQFYPHTNYNVLAIGTYMADTAAGDGPITVLPGSHEGPLYDLYDDDGNWTGSLKDRDAAALDTSKAVTLEGPAGSITVHSARTVHCSAPTAADNAGSQRPLLINAYNSADAFAFTPHPSESVNSRKIIRGEPARWAHLDPRPCPVPPDWSKGYTSIFAAQAGEDKKAGASAKKVSGGMM